MPLLLRIVVVSVKVKSKPYAYQLQLGVSLDKSNPLEQFIPFSLLSARNASQSQNSLTRAGLTWDVSKHVMYVPTNAACVVQLPREDNTDYIDPIGDAFEFCLYRLTDGDPLPKVFRHPVRLNFGPGGVVQQEERAKFGATARFTILIESADSTVAINAITLADAPRSDKEHAAMLVSLAKATTRMGEVLQAAVDGSPFHTQLCEWSATLVSFGEVASAVLGELPGGEAFCCVVASLFHAVVDEGDAREICVALCNEVTMTLKGVAEVFDNALTRAETFHECLKLFKEKVFETVCDIQNFRRRSNLRYFRSTRFRSDMENRSVELRRLQTRLHQHTTCTQLNQVLTNQKAAEQANKKPHLRYNSAEDHSEVMINAMMLHYSASSLLDDTQQELRNVFQQQATRLLARGTAVTGVLMKVDDLTPIRITFSRPESFDRPVADRRRPRITVDSTEVLAAMDSSDIHALVLDGDPWMGKTTMVYHLAMLQSFSRGVVIPVKLSALALYLSDKQQRFPSSDHAANPSHVSARELIFVALGCDDARAELVDRIYFGIKKLAPGGRIAWLFDGLERVISITDKLFHEVLEDIVAAAEGSKLTTMFGERDVVVITARGNLIPRAKQVATIAPWSIPDAVEVVKKYFHLKEVRDLIDIHNGKNAAVQHCTSIVAEVQNTLESPECMGTNFTQPVLLEMMCYCKAMNCRKPLPTVAELYSRTVALKLVAARRQYRDSWRSTDKEIVSLCMASSLLKESDDEFFELQLHDPVSLDLSRSGLVRGKQQGGVNCHQPTMIVKFDHALYFALLSSTLLFIASRFAVDDFV
jgi:hypothetical protein